MRTISNEELDQWIARYEQDRARAQEKVDWIEKRGIRFQQAAGSDPMKDVTDELLGYWKADVRLYESQIAFYQGLKE